MNGPPWSRVEAGHPGPSTSAPRPVSGALSRDLVSAVTTVGRVATRSPAAAVRAAVTRVEGIADPVRRAVAATELLEAIGDAQEATAQIRYLAAGELHTARGWTVAQVAALLGVSVARAHQVIKGLARWSTERAD